MEASYRNVAKTLHISKNTIFHELDFLGEQCKSFEQVAHELHPQWSGYVLIDGKTIYIKKDKAALLLTADATTQDIPVAGLYESENAANYKILLEQLRDDIGYPIKGIIVDGDPAVLTAISSEFSKIPLQLCIRHYDENLKRHFRYYFHGITDGVPRFLDMVHEMLYVKNSLHLDQVYREYLDWLPFFYVTGLQSEVDRVESNFGRLWTHLQYPEMPRTNNVIEGIIRQLSRKIDDTDGFNSMRTAWNSLKLMIMNYRFKRFTCSRIKGHNGKCPLQLAGVDISGINWVMFSKNKSEA